MSISTTCFGLLVHLQEQNWKDVQTALEHSQTTLQHDVLTLTVALVRYTPSLSVPATHILYAFFTQQPAPLCCKLLAVF